MSADEEALWALSVPVDDIVVPFGDETIAFHGSPTDMRLARVIAAEPEFLPFDLVDLYLLLTVRKRSAKQLTEATELAPAIERWTLANRLFFVHTGRDPAGFDPSSTIERALNPNPDDSDDSDGGEGDVEGGGTDPL